MPIDIQQHRSGSFCPSMRRLPVQCLYARLSTWAQPAEDDDDDLTYSIRNEFFIIYIQHTDKIQIQKWKSRNDRAAIQKYKNKNQTWR